MTKHLLLAKLRSLSIFVVNGYGSITNKGFGSKDGQISTNDYYNEYNYGYPEIEYNDNYENNGKWSLTKIREPLVFVTLNVE